MGEAIPNRSWDRRPQLTNDDSSWQDRLRRRLGASQDHVPPLTTGPISPQKVESGLEKGVTIANEKLNLALDQLAGRLESKGKETAVTGVTFYVIAANNAETFHYLAATYNSQSKRLIIAGTEQSRSNAKELKTDQLTLVKGSKGAWMLSMEENSNNGKIQPQFRMLDRDEVALSIEGKPGGVNLPLRTEWLNKLALESIKPTWVGRPIDCDSW